MSYESLTIACLMPTYGRRKKLLEESIQCFASQDHPHKRLFIYDDLGTLANTRCDVPGVTIISTTQRAPSVGAKYNEMLRIFDLNGVDAYAVWDDDDIYNRKHLSTHAAILQRHNWSKPSRIISAYFDPPQEEDASGRFHGSIALRREFAHWIETTRATFDQEFLRQLHEVAGPPGDPCTLAPPQYVYRWQTSGGGHCSGLMGRETWYADYRPDSREPIDSLGLSTNLA